MKAGKLARRAAWVIAAVAGLAATFLLVLLAVNWNDRPPSPEAIALERLVRDRTAVTDGNNGYVYLLGMSAPPAEDPALWGARRKAWLERLDASTARPLVAPGPVMRVRDGTTNALSTACQRATAACAEALRAQPHLLDQWVGEESWRLARYDALLHRDGWREPIPTQPDTPLPAYRHVLDAQTLFLLDTWRRARGGDALTVRNNLDRDARFWRGALAHSDLLISKMIAAAALRRNLAFGSLAIGELPQAAVQGALPPSWLVPLTNDERSMLRAMAGEWFWSRTQLRATGESQARVSVGQRLGMQRLFRLQDTLNESARFAFRFSKASAADYPQLASALADSVRDPGFSLYNPGGRMLSAIASPAYPAYAEKIADLEGMRRAAVAAAQLHAAGVERAGVATALASLPAPLRDPYTAAPLHWDARTRSVGFQAHARPFAGDDYSITY